MFDYHNASKSDTVQHAGVPHVPVFAQHRARYRADVSSVVTTDAAVSAQLTALGLDSLCGVPHYSSAYDRIACSQNIGLLITKPLRSSLS